jgi:4-diphosphocytidyl-2-C-methyl-D-erythritol kinase
MHSLHIAAPAKINLHLKILWKRPDGYHALESLMQKVALYDHLELALDSRPGIHLSCNGADLPEDSSNLAFRAAEVLLAQVGREEQGVRIRLQKNIPCAAGLGGGSSDAAAVLKGLNQLLQLHCSVDTLAALGLRLGTDVPFFVHDFATAWATGRGEELREVQALRGFKVLLVYPDLAVSTQWAYETFSKQNAQISLTETEKKCTLSSLTQAAFTGVNDLETVSLEHYPVLGELKHLLQGGGAAKAMMSGSGSTVFGLFACETQAERCRLRLQKIYKQVFLVDPL